jgi:uncharacterized protein (TIGR02301 family)
MLTGILMARIALIVSLCFCLGGGPAAAQTFFQQQEQPQPPPRAFPPRYQPQALPRPGQLQPGQQPRGQAPAPVPNTPAPYDRDLQRLSEILGSLHFLRGICGSNEGQKWRNEAQALIDAEAPAGERHNQMVASFNRGYRAFQQSYRTCTPAANFAIRRYLDEGARIARDITARYAN